MLRKRTLLSIVVPIYNEEESIEEVIIRLSILQQKLADELDFEFIFVDDGSKDKSFSILSKLAKANSNIKVISFTRNFGHQMAITAGIDNCSGDYVAIIDADLQDPPELIAKMYEVARTGFDVVYGKRKSRSGETIFKKVTAAVFYRLLNYMCEIDIPIDTGDFRLISRHVVDALKQMRERHRFMRGMIPWLGFKSTPVEYNREKRYAGTTKYPFRKMMVFATNAILSFSTKPLTVAVKVGFITILGGFIFGIYIFYLKLFTNIPVPGLAAILASIIFFGGVQILLIGLIGGYVARIFEESKNRPLYLIDEKINL